MKKNLFTLLLVSFCFFISAQPIQSWFKQINNLATGSAIIKSDTSGNVYVAGGFSGTINFGDTILYSNNIYNKFLAKFTFSGTLLWANAFGNPNLNCNVRSILIDSMGNPIISGDFQANIQFTSPGASFVLQGNGYQQPLNTFFYDIYTAKFNRNGTGIIWAKDISISNNYSDYVTNTCADAHGNLYYTGGWDFDGSGLPKGMILKLNPLGDTVWVKKLPLMLLPQFTGLEIDSNQNIYVVGYYQANSSSYNSFLWKLNTVGASLFLNTTGTFNDIPWACRSVLDAQSSTIFAGRFDTAQFNGTIITTNQTSANFFAKYNSSGQFVSVYVDTVVMGSNNYVSSLKLDELNNLYALFDTAIIKYDSFMNKVWSIPIPATTKMIDLIEEDKLFVNGFNNSGDFVAKYVAPTTLNKIAGNVFNDSNLNCSKDSLETNLKGRIIEITPGPYYAYTDTLGNYSQMVERIYSPFTIKQLMSNPFYEASCGLQQYIASFTNFSDSSVNNNFSNKPTYNCPLLKVDIATTNGLTYFVKYENIGPIASSNSFITINGISGGMGNSDGVYSYLGSDKYKFDLGTIPAESEGSFYFNTYFSSGSFCLEAEIYPTNNCLPNNDPFDSTALVMYKNCTSDSIKFTIKCRDINLNNTHPAIYNIYRDSVLIILDTFNISTCSDSIVRTLSNDGANYQMKIIEISGFPKIKVTVAYQNAHCDTLEQIITGDLTNSLFNENNYSYSRCCWTFGRPHDPNEKIPFPVGTSCKHYIDSTTVIDYQINFQNTGTDTAHNIIILDTLSNYLDISTVQPGASSHPYQFRIYGNRILEWTLENAMLPDSNVNLIGSNGFIKFKTNQNFNNPKGAVIENSASIYFDQELPIKTNTAFHTVWDTTFVCLWPVPVFNINQMDLQVNVINNSKYCNLYMWDFGDNTPTDSSINPIHNYTSLGTYNICLTSSNQCKTTVTCKSVVVSSISTGIKQKKFQFIKISPNPSNGVFNFITSAPHTCTIQIIDMLGREIKTIESPSRLSFEIDLSGEPQGIYHVKIKDSKFSEVKKIIIVK